MRPWRELELLVAQYLSNNGYSAETNVFRIGRSGGRHEVDVLAKSSGGITQIEIMVECKAWKDPIEKDTIAKAIMIRDDLGLNKAIIVSLEGWRSGAEKAAEAHGVELWDSSELEKRIGRVETARLRDGGTEPTRLLRGPTPVVAEAKAVEQLHRERRGFFRKEELLGHCLCWVPLLRAQISVQEATTHRWTPITVTKELTNYHDGLTGTFLHPHDAACVAFTDIRAENVIPPVFKSKNLGRDIAEIFEKLTTLKRESALHPWKVRANEVGLACYYKGASVTETEHVAWPFWVGLFSLDNARRIVALDAVRDVVSAHVSASLTQHLALVLEATGLG